MSYTILNINKDFSDNFGNKILGILGTSSVTFQGEKAKLLIKKLTNYNANLKIKLASGATLKIGKNVRLSGKVTLEVKNNGFMEIGDNYQMVNVNISCHKNAKIYLGNNGSIARDSVITAEEGSTISFGSECTFRVSTFIVAHKNTDITFGNDCMIAAKFHARSDDGHSIFDLSKSQKINEHGSTRRGIVLGNHVWIGYDCMLSYGTNMGSNSIVGSKSLVRDEFPANCIVVGTPAKVIKENVDWERDSMMDFSEYSKGRLKRSVQKVGKSLCSLY